MGIYYHRYPWIRCNRSLVLHIKYHRPIEQLTPLYSNSLLIQPTCKGYRFGNAKLKKQVSQKEINRETQQSLNQINSNLTTLKENDEKQTQELRKVNQSIQNLNNELRNEFKGSLNEIKESVLSIQKEEVEINEPKILDRGYFVIVYSTKTYDDAEAIIQRMGKQDVKGYIIKDSKRTFFYVYTAAYDDLNSALSQSEKERQRGFTGAWVLVVK